ncbi:hypothetical protein THRCLA_20219 [Thraustotheca clavata]|uniref:Serine-threonine/tyrosine-protein kinase catalytic domain-containing protein n=1 Tax=Thraustotheca clavata TaxID=74557 RepID=A0A1W0A9Y7_9STRA|nr:hypothetical protein THRCLA_20219 [Thraustotheca clavata]
MLERRLQTLVWASPSQDHGLSSTTLALIIAGGVLVFGLLIAVVCHLQAKAKRRDKLLRREAQRIQETRAMMECNYEMQSDKEPHVQLANDVRFDSTFAHTRIPHHELFNLRLVAKGSGTVVFRAIFNSMEIAVKQLLPSQCSCLLTVTDFMREIRLCSTLEHQNIVRFIGLAWTEGPSLSDLSLLTEFMPHGDLATFLAFERKTPIADRRLLASWEAHVTKHFILVNLINPLTPSLLPHGHKTLERESVKAKAKVLSNAFIAMLVGEGKLTPSFTIHIPSCILDLATQCLSFNPNDPADCASLQQTYKANAAICSVKFDALNITLANAFCNDECLREILALNQRTKACQQAIVDIEIFSCVQCQSVFTLHPTFQKVCGINFQHQNYYVGEFYYQFSSYIANCKVQFPTVQFPSLLTPSSPSSGSTTTYIGIGVDLIVLVLLVIVFIIYRRCKHASAKSFNLRTITNTGENYSKSLLPLLFQVDSTRFDADLSFYHQAGANTESRVYCNASIAMRVAQGKLAPSFTKCIPSAILELAIECLSLNPNYRPSPIQLSMPSSTPNE